MRSFLFPMRRERKQAELLLVPMIDIFTVLVSFLLMTAVFSRIAVMQIDLPSSAAAKPTTEPAFRLEVIVRQDGFELSDGKRVISTVPKLKGAYDLLSLTEHTLQVKREHPTSEDASVLAEPKVPYDELIQAMDAIRSTEVPATDALIAGQGAAGAQTATAGAEPVKIALFTNIALGDAP